MIGWATTHWHELAEVIGTALEILGLFLAANAILKVPAKQLPRVLASALVKGPDSRAAAKISEVIDHDDIAKSLRGFSLVIIGLAMKATPSAVGLFH